MSCCCSPCDMMPRPHSQRTDAHIPCRCVPRYLCAYLLTEAGCSDQYDEDQRSSALLTYDCDLEQYTGTVVCRDIQADLKVTFERDAYCQVYLVVESVAAGAVQDAYGDSRLKRLLTDYDRLCELRNGPYQFDVEIEGVEAQLTIDRPDFVERCEFTPRCGPNSEPYECVCHRAVMEFDVSDPYGPRRRGLDKACFKEFFNDQGQVICRGWEFDFLDSSNQSVLYGLVVRICLLDEEEPLRFSLDIRAPQEYGTYLTSPSTVVVRCVSEYDPTANMNASWDLVVDGREVHLEIRGDLHLSRFQCCHCWVRNLCVTRFGSQVFDSFVVGAEPSQEERAWNLGFGNLRLDCDCDGLPVLVFTPDDPYEDETTIAVDCPLLNARGTFASVGFSYKDEQVTITGLPCKPSCPKTAPCCGREVPRTLYLEIVPSAEAVYICDRCDLHTLIPIHYTGQAQADPNSAVWEGEVQTSCEGPLGGTIKAELRCNSTGDCTLLELDLISDDNQNPGSTTCFSILSQGPDPGCTCDPLYAVWSWTITATPCCTNNPEFPTIHGKIYLTE